MNEPLSQVQARVLEFIQSRAGLPPTRVEIRDHFGWRSANAAEDHLRALAKKGAIKLLPGVSRGIQVLATDPARHCPTCTCGAMHG